MSALDEVERRVTELLSRNRITSTSNDVSRIAASLLPGSGKTVNVTKVATAISKELVFLSGRNRQELARIIVSQIDLSGIESEPIHDSYSPNSKYAIYVATDLELTAVLSCLSETEEGLYGNAVVYSGLARNGTRVAVVKTGQGNNTAATVVSGTLKGIKPDAAIFLGISGALYEIAFGAVVIASYVYDYESADIGDKKTARAKSLESHPRLIQVASSVLQQGVAGVEEIIVRPIASGEKLIRRESSDEVGWINLIASDAAVVEMEGLGFLRACSFVDTPALVVRSVSDHLGDKSGAGDRMYQPKAAQNAAKVSFAIFEGLEKLEN